MHTAMDALRQGFVTAANGCRVGICGTAAMRGGEIMALGDVCKIGKGMQNAEKMIE
jgi:stage III sporulation protein SpoIIIAA